MSILRSKHSGWTHEGTRTPFFGGGGGGGQQQPNTTYSQTSNIPEYAQPYVETMLGATQKQLFDMQGNEITGFKPYKPYSADLNDYVAGFQPLQQQAMTATGELKVPGQYGQATEMTGIAGLGSLGLAGQMAGAGSDYARMATDPNAMQGYMSPYMQNVVDYQKSQALRDYNLGTGVRKAQAVGQGAFGGNRQALMEAEAQRSLGNQLQGITATGSQKAFEDAQRQQQFGAQLGMQGRQAALQGVGQYGQMAGQLGQLGGQELAARQGIIQSQYGMGQQQQALEQQKINQAMQDYANMQQYPLMQLGVMSNMLRGLPMQSSTTNQYQAAPNALTQGIGAVGAGASLYNALRGKEGGLPSEFESSKTGIKSYYEGDVVESTKSDLYDLPLEELDKRAKNSTSPTIKRLATAIAKEKRMGLAGGGIIAFANPNETNNQGVVKEDPAAVRQAYIDAAKLQQNVIPENLRYDPEKIALKNELIQDVGSQLNRTPAPVSIRDSGGQGITEDVLKRIAKRDYSGIAGENQTRTMSANQLSPETKQSEAAYEAARPVAGKPPAPASIKDAAPAPASAGIKPATVAAPAPAGIKPAAAPGAAPAAAVTGIKTPGGSIAEEYGLVRPADDPRAKMSTEELAKEKLAFLGPDVRKEERAGLMAERASAKDEARRAQSLRFAEFFADWGSKPGGTIKAGLDALKEKVPSLVTDARKASEIRRAINKDIAGLDKADRLEKAGAWDEAAKLKSELGKDGRKTYGDQLNFLSARLTDQSRERTSSASDQSRERIAAMAATSKVEAAGNKGGFKTIQEAENALDKHLTEGNKIGSQYSTDLAIVKARKADYDAGKLDAEKKTRYEDSLANVNKFKNREKELRDNVNFFKQNKGMTTASSGSSNEPSGVDLNSFWSQK